jgi:hypothetical protein
MSTSRAQTRSAFCVSYPLTVCRLISACARRKAAASLTARPMPVVGGWLTRSTPCNVLAMCSASLPTSSAMVTK